MMSANEDAEGWKQLALQLRHEVDELYRAEVRVFFYGYAVGCASVLLFGYGRVKGWW